MALNETHDPNLRSWVDAANAEGCAFAIQNLPFGVVRRAGTAERFRIAVAIGDQALDLLALRQTGLLTSPALDCCQGTRLNALMALDARHWSQLRAQLSALLAFGNRDQSKVATCLLPLVELEHEVPADIGDYTDFYTSIYHATNIGKLFRPDEPLLPNYPWIPIGYHGRSSSIGISGQPVTRPVGQIKLPDSEKPHVGPCRMLDYELELGIFVGTGNALGSTITIEDAEAHLFGLCLLNDWSARDIQAWEYQPLGPFLGKSFATTISPWVVTAEALAPFRCPLVRESMYPPPLPYLHSASNAASGGLDIRLEVGLQTARMRDANEAPQTLSRGNYQDAFWTAAQLLTHHSVNGCNLRPGDLLGTGTLSGPTPDSAGALMELTAGGAEPLTLRSGEQRAFLEDGDTVTLSARCEREGAVGIGFGSASATIVSVR